MGSDPSGNSGFVYADATELPVAAAYRGRMEHTTDAARTNWIVERIDDPWRGTMHDVVPRGFEAYARVLHRPGVRWIPGERLPSPEEWVRLDERAQQALFDRTLDEPTTWSAVAEAFGTRLHPLAQYGALVGMREDPNGWQSMTAADGREFAAPIEGAIDADLLARVVRHLLDGPTPGGAAVWEGWGGLLTVLGEGNGRAMFTIPGGTDPRHSQMLGESTRDPFNRPFGRPTLHEGILSKEVSDAPRLQLPGRGHVPFVGDLAVFARDDWELEVPWRDRISEAYGFPPHAHSPSLLWPDDHAWVLVTEVDYDSTVIGGSAAVVDAIVSDPELEAFVIPEGADLSWGGDAVNR